MEELKIIYGLITSVWKLIKKYGCNKLTDEQWEAFVEDGIAARKVCAEEGEQYDLLYRGLFRRCRIIISGRKEMPVQDEYRRIVEMLKRQGDRNREEF